jgi:hypothetical protein
MYQKGSKFVKTKQLMPIPNHPPLSDAQNKKTHHPSFFTPKYYALHSSHTIIHPPFFTLHPSTFSFTVEAGV